MEDVRAEDIPGWVNYGEGWRVKGFGWPFRQGPPGADRSVRRVAYSPMAELGRLDVDVPPNAGAAMSDRAVNLGSRCN